MLGCDGWFIEQFVADFQSKQHGNAYLFKPFNLSEPTAQLMATDYHKVCWPLDVLEALVDHGTVQKLLHYELDM